ncbi:MAG: DUF1365 domain-containing protein [Planctomycetota bacterium]
MHSAIYEGWVRHRRFSPVENAFRYRLFLVYLDLAELDEVFRGRWLWSTRRFNLAYLRRKDHLGDPAVPIDQAVRDLVEERLGARPAGPIRLLTHLRYWGHCFNPVSFYYCYDPAGERVETLVAEVNNTPWHERHCYVLGGDLDEGVGPWHRYRFPKAFHVSPFIDMTVDYDWRLREPGKSINVHLMDLDRATGERFFDATLGVERREVTARQLGRVLVAYPLMTLKVVTLIHWQALKLWRKGATFYVHPS